ncbi:uncharacterized protein PHALS_01120 [Plasmopara halstedii]|uniref:Uncharacterized protein n=1 Tax=Plasmopara halstedii TaxID=4781 RepID=A0A0P1AU83_PLAHL|nr:uncharacterized protein PHALS_01120 [Plasmopara halstedii]CEG44783.1 hypothetical protein PHALS_01120 [Plasmopara halstedii]|eukprot:XP_024581152.1 hypothetical protein PHALS_01120 [Plasmopara halstedii]
MTDSTILDDINAADSAITGADLLVSLDRYTTLFSDTDIELQLLDLTPGDNFFDSLEDERHFGATDSDSKSIDTESVASISPRVSEAENIRMKDAIRRSNYRQKRKAEKFDLQLKIQELTSQLTALQMKKEADKAKSGLGSVSMAVWKALADRHLQARLVAEEQQRRLREAIERRSALIKDMGAIVCQRLSQEHSESYVPPRKKSRVESPDMKLYGTFVKELDDAYIRTDSIFSQSEVQMLQTDDSNYGMRAVPKKANYYELAGKKTTPFPFERVRLLIDRVSIVENRTSYEKIDLSDVAGHTSAFKCRFETRLGDAVGCLIQHVLLRYYKEADRVVCICRKFTEGEGVYAGMHADETGWNVIERCANGAGTVIKSIFRYVPMSFSTVASADGKLKKFTDKIISIGEEDCQTCGRKLEALLLDDSLGDACQRRGTIS